MAESNLVAAKQAAFCRVDIEASSLVRAEDQQLE
jgi:hypothetical protein